jgi:hypothetical protein
MPQRIKFFLVIICFSNCLLAQSNKQLVGVGIGYGDLIAPERQSFNFSTIKFTGFYLIEKKYLAFKIGYANWQASTKQRNITQNSLDLLGGYHHTHQRLGVSNVLIGITQRYAHGVDTMPKLQIIGQSTVGIIGLLHQRIHINKQVSFFHELEFSTASIYNSISYCLGLTFRINK